MEDLLTRLFENLGGRIGGPMTFRLVPQPLVASVLAIAVIIDLIYQLMEFGWVYPGETLLVAFALACVPYLLLRGPANRIARNVRRRHLPQEEH